MRAAVTPALIEVAPVLSSTLPIIQEIVSVTPLESSSVNYTTVFIFGAITASHMLWGPVASLIAMATAVAYEIIVSTPVEVSIPVVATTSTLVESALESIPTLGPHRVVLINEAMLNAGEAGGIAVVTSWFLYAVLGSYYSHSQAQALSAAKSRASFVESRSTTLVHRAYPVRTESSVSSGRGFVVIHPGGALSYPLAITNSVTNITHVFVPNIFNGYPSLVSMYHHNLFSHGPLVLFIPEGALVPTPAVPQVVPVVPVLPRLPPLVQAPVILSPVSVGPNSGMATGRWVFPENPVATFGLNAEQNPGATIRTVYRSLVEGTYAGRNESATHYLEYLHASYGGEVVRLINEETEPNHEHLRFLLTPGNERVLVHQASQVLRRSHASGGLVSIHGRLIVHAAYGPRGAGYLTRMPFNLNCFISLIMTGVSTPLFKTIPLFDRCSLHLGNNLVQGQVLLN